MLDWGLRVAGLVLLLGCGSRSGMFAEARRDGQPAPYPWQVDGASGSVQLPDSCVQDWEVLYEADGIGPALAVSAGELIFAVGAGTPPRAELLALAIDSSSGDQRVLHGGARYADIWLDGPDLLLWTGERLLRVPFQGGSEEVVLDLAGPGAPVGTMLVEDDTFYWTRTDSYPRPVEIWQQTPLSGRPSLVASLADMGSPLLAATDGALIVADGSAAFSVPLGGGAPQPLDVIPDAELAGVDGLGAYYLRVANRTRRGGRAVELELQRSAANGSAATRLWRGAAGQRLDHLWPVGAGWLATGAYYMFDGRRHSVLAYIDANGEETLIACDRGDSELAGDVVFWGRAFYAVTSSGQRRRVVEIRLPE